MTFLISFLILFNFFFDPPPLKEDIKKLIPKYTKLLKKLEAATISQVEEKAILMALAMELDDLYNDFNTAEDWYYRLIPDAVDKLGKKRKRL